MALLLWSYRNRARRIAVLPGIDGQLVQLHHTISNGSYILYTVPANKITFVLNVGLLVTMKAASNCKYYIQDTSASVIYDIFRNDFFDTQITQALHIDFPLPYQLSQGAAVVMVSKDANCELRGSLYAIECDDTAGM